ncbi:cytochrome P450 71AV8-like [Triticum dicoccoides]|uniref:cytochrome P450 71AV8-like n=1 Tax=Triticum dicoccoides TaxID=85692 RepID=UPI0018918970|nr:cytochrome P450 71AV8-like [Triticum dicoccoides]
MDQLWFSLCLIASSTLLALWFCKRSTPKKRLPPGPWSLPIIGSLHHLVGLLPHRTIMELSRRHGPLMLLRLGEVCTVVVSDAEAAALVMKTNDLAFANRPCSPTQEIFGCGGKGILFAPYGDHLRHVRKLCNVALLSSQSQQVKRMEVIRAEEVGNLLHCITTAASTSATINLSDMVTKLTNHVVSRAVYGGKFTQRQQQEYLHELGKAIEVLGGFYLVDLFPSWRLVRWLSSGEPRMRRSCGRIHQIITDIIEERQAVRAAVHGGSDEDLLDVLLRLQKEDTMEFPLTTEIIRGVLFDMFGGGTETSGTILEWAMSELVCHPEAMAKAQLEIRDVLGQDRAIITNSDLGELQYMRMVIKEALRLHPPTPLVHRAAREDCTIMGYDVIKGNSVLVNIFAVCRDQKYWKNPEEFIPERFENNKIDYNGTSFEFTPFGAGRRQCPGISFATSTMEITLANLLYHFDWILPGGKTPESLDMSESFGIAVLGRKYALQLRAIPRVCSKATKI